MATPPGCGKGGVRVGAYTLKSFSDQPAFLFFPSCLHITKAQGKFTHRSTKLRLISLRARPEGMDGSSWGWAELLHRSKIPGNSCFL